MPSLRYFYLISFILLIAGFSVATILSFSYVEDNILKSTVTNTAKATVDEFNNSIWRKYRKPLAYLPCDRRCPKTGGLSQEFTEFKLRAERKSVLSFTLFNENAIETLNKEKTFSDYHPAENQENIFESVMKGKVYSEIIHDYTVNNKSYSVVRALFPIKPRFSLGEDKAINNSVIEIYFDITPLWSQPSQLKYIAIAVFILVLSIIFGTMFMMTSRAEVVLAKQHETNVDLATAAASAEKESKEKSQFLANVSHELRTPLNAIIGFSEIIKDEVMGPLNNQQYKDYIGDIYISGVHLLSLINDILDYSKAEAGKLTVDLADVDVTKIMKNSLRLVTPRANEANVELIGEVPKKHYILHTDGKRLKQVLLNLFSNAVKFTPSGGTVTLYAWHNLTENMFVIEVKDTGVGIAPKDISKVMATFGQVENKLSRKYEGTGLGLPLSNKLVELMSGKLEIKSEPGEGTIVSISLPYIEEQGTGTYNEMDALKNQNNNIKDAPKEKVEQQKATEPKIEEKSPSSEPVNITVEAQTNITAEATPSAEPVNITAEAQASMGTAINVTAEAEAKAAAKIPQANDIPQAAEIPQPTAAEESHSLPPMHVDEPTPTAEDSSLLTNDAPSIETPNSISEIEPAQAEATKPPSTNDAAPTQEAAQPVIMRSSIDTTDFIEMPSSFSTVDEPTTNEATPSPALDIPENPATTTSEQGTEEPSVIAMPPMPSDSDKA